MSIASETQSKFTGATKNVEKFAKESLNPNALERVSHDVGEQAGMLAGKASASVMGYFDEGRSYVRDNPVKGIAIGVAAGVLAGSILTIALRPKR